MLRISGGKIYDPANGIDGAIKDLCIDDHGKFVDTVSGGRTIDATGMIVFPGGVDVHTHVAGGAINFARAMTPEDHRRTQAFIRTKSRRSGLGGMAPTTFATGYLYAGMGWTTVNEAAVPVLSARHTHEELSDIPIVDKSTLTLMGNNEILLDQLEDGEYERVGGTRTLTTDAYGQGVQFAPDGQSLVFTDAVVCAVMLPLICTFCEASFTAASGIRWASVVLDA